MLNHLIHVVFDTVFSDDYEIYCFNLSDKKSVDCEYGENITLDRYSYSEKGYSKITSDIIQALCNELCYKSLNEDFFDEIEVDTMEDDKVEIENKDYNLDLYFVWSLAPMHMANLEDTFIRANRLKRQIQGINEMIFDKCSDISMFIPDNHLEWSPIGKLGKPFSETTLTKNARMIIYKFSVPAHCIKYNKLQKYIDKIYNAIDKCSYRMVHNILSVRLYMYYVDFGYFGLDTLMLSEDYLDYQFNPLLRYQSTKIFADVLCDKDSILESINKLKLDTVIYGNTLSTFYFSTKDLELSKLKKPFDFYKDNIAIKIFPMAQVKKFSTTIKYDPAADNIDNLNPNFLDDQSIFTDIINIVNNYNGDVLSLEDNDTCMLLLRDVLYEITTNDMLRHYHIGVVVKDQDLSTYI